MINWLKKNDILLYIVISLIITVILVYYLIAWVFSLFSTPLPTYIFSNKIIVTNSTSNSINIVGNTLVLVNGSYLTKNIYVSKNSVSYINLTGNYDILKVYGTNNSDFVLNLDGNNNNFYSYNIKNIGFVINGSDNIYYKNNGNSCTVFNYVYSIGYNKKLVEAPC